MTKEIKPQMARGVDLSGIRNRNEPRVAAVLERMLEERPDFAPDPLDVQDMYALTLNMLAPRYVQKGTIVLKEQISDNDIEAAITKAFQIVNKQPSY